MTPKTQFGKRTAHISKQNFSNYGPELETIEVLCHTLEIFNCTA